MIFLISFTVHWISFFGNIFCSHYNVRSVLQDNGATWFLSAPTSLPSSVRSCSTMHSVPAPLTHIALTALWQSLCFLQVRKKKIISSWTSSKLLSKYSFPPTPVLSVVCTQETGMDTTKSVPREVMELTQSPYTVLHGTSQGKCRRFCWLLPTYSADLRTLRPYREQMWLGIFSSQTQGSLPRQACCHDCDRNQRSVFDSAFLGMRDKGNEMGREDTFSAWTFRGVWLLWGSWYHGHKRVDLPACLLTCVCCGASAEPGFGPADGQCVRVACSQGAGAELRWACPRHLSGDQGLLPGTGHRHTVGIGLCSALSNMHPLLRRCYAVGEFS